MKNFFIVIFGGIFLIFFGIAIFGHDYWGLRTDLVKYFSDLASNGVANITNAVTTPIQNSSISGLKRYVRFTASEEESLLNAATLSLPKNYDENISAKAYLVVRLRDNKTMIEYDADRLLPIASLTKLITASVAKKLVKDNTKVKITADIMNTFGNTAQFKIGESIMAGDLYYPLLMVSSNDAAEALARSYSRKEFIKYMNNFVQYLGAYRTTFYDPSGLSPDNRSSANDLAIIYEWVEKNYPELIDITKQKTRSTRLHVWPNPAHFLNWSNYEGGKNGYTDEALQTGIAVFHINKERYLFVVLGSHSRDQDMIKLMKKL